MISPTLPEVGTIVTVFGVTAVVDMVEPASDYTWRVELSSRTEWGYDECWTIIVPTDTRTTETYRPLTHYRS